MDTYGWLLDTGYPYPISFEMDLKWQHHNEQWTTEKKVERQSESIPAEEW